MKKPNLFQRILMGAGYLEGYGHHPGTVPMIILTLGIGVSGAYDIGWHGFFGGLLVGGTTFGFMWLYGAVGRADAYLANKKKSNDRD